MSCDNKNAIAFFDALRDPEKSELRSELDYRVTPYEIHRTFLEVCALAKAYTDDLLAKFHSGKLQSKGRRETMKKAYVNGYMQCLEDLNRLPERDKEKSE